MEKTLKLLVVMLDGLGPEFMNLPFLKTLEPKPLETYSFTYPSVYATLTGLKPRIEDFWRDGELTRNIFSWRDYNVEFLWDKLKCRQLYLNIPFTYPPKEINGIMVSYGLYGLHAYPKYIETILRKIRYIPDVDVSKPDFLIKCHEAVRKRTYAAVKLGRDMEFIYMAYTSSDRILHRRLEIGLFDLHYFMNTLDSNLQLLFNVLEPRHYIVYSDHGFTIDGYHGPEHPSTYIGIIATDLADINHINEIHKIILECYE